MGRLDCGVHRSPLSWYALHCTDHTVIVGVSNEAGELIGKRSETSSTGTEARGEGRLVNLKLRRNGLHSIYKHSISHK